MLAYPFIGAHYIGDGTFLLTNIRALACEGTGRREGDGQGKQQSCYVCERGPYGLSPSRHQHGRGEAVWL